MYDTSSYKHFAKKTREIGRQRPKFSTADSAALGSRDVHISLIHKLLRKVVNRAEVCPSGVGKRAHTVDLLSV